MIQGPPGTGKTTAIVESIRRILARNPNASILLSSHSNDAVDTGQERLLGFSHVRQARVAEPGKVPRRLRHTLVEGDDLEPFNLVAGTCKPARDRFAAALPDVRLADPRRGEQGARPTRRWR